jgi:hypothetical protein
MPQNFRNCIMGSFTVCFLTGYNLVDKIKKVEVGRACGTHAREENAYRCEGKGLL